MNICILRLFNTFGPRQRDLGYGGVISIFTRRILNNVPPIIYGDGTQTRDYTYVTDAVNAYDLLLNHEEPIAEPVNIGSGYEISIIDIAGKIIDECGKTGQIEPVHSEPRMGEVKRLIANASRAKELLGWKAEYDFEKGLKEFVQWYKNYGFEERIRIE
jgi:nucleoside-diphosphate-sugar epimerase